MKIISLNTWGGRALQPLMEFFVRQGPEVDIFCLQEMHDTTPSYRASRHPSEYVCPDLMHQTARVLPEHVGRFATWDDLPDRMSIALFIRHTLRPSAVREVEIYTPLVAREFGSAVISPRKMQMATFGDLLVAHCHGAWLPSGKGDTPVRIEQSHRIVHALRAWAGPKILMGDFNLTPQTTSWSIVRAAFESELVTDRGWTTTRTPLYRRFQDSVPDLYADYCFVSGVTVREFRVMRDLVSDHAPLLLEID